MYSDRENTLKKMYKCMYMGIPVAPETGLLNEHVKSNKNCKCVYLT